MTSAYTRADARQAAAVLDAYLCDTDQPEPRDTLRHIVVSVLPVGAASLALPATLGELADEHWTELERSQRQLRPRAEDEVCMSDTCAGECLT